MCIRDRSKSQNAPRGDHRADAGNAAHGNGGHASNVECDQSIDRLDPESVTHVRAQVDGADITGGDTADRRRGDRGRVGKRKERTSKECKNRGAYRS